MARRQDEQNQLRWQIVSIRKRGQLLGIVRAKDAETAIKVWIEDYNVTDPEERRRLAAYPLTA